MSVHGLDLPEMAARRDGDEDEDYHNDDIGDDADDDKDNNDDQNNSQTQAPALGIPRSPWGFHGAPWTQQQLHSRPDDIGFLASW